MNYKVFTEYKDKIYNSNNMEAEKIYNKAKKQTSNKTETKLLRSMIQKYKPNKSLSFQEFKSCVETIQNSKYSESKKIYENIKTQTDDVAQLNTLKRIVQMKSTNNMKKNNTPSIDSNTKDPDLDLDSDIIYKYKPCPHCSKRNMAKEGTQYIVCGYTTRGYDSRGCRMDWCFKCGKKLCKQWDIDILYDENNRIHDNKCCKNFANKTNDTYPDNYCQCHYENVNRNT